MRFAWTLPGVIQFVAVAVALLAPARAEDAPSPELDIVATAKLNTPKEHADQYAAALRMDATSCFPGLLAPVPQRRIVDRGVATMAPAAQPPPKDGGAKHRLLIEHTGAVAFGNITNTVAKTSGGAAGDATTRTWFMDVQSQGTLQFRLMRWDGARYTDLDKWSAPAPKNEQAKPQVEIARLSGHVGEASAAKLPISLDEARGRVCISIVPGSIKDLILTRLLPVTVAARKGSAKLDKDADLTLDITIENKSPWPLKALETVVPWQNKPHAIGDKATPAGGCRLELPEPLAPGQKTTLTAPAKPQTARPKPGVYDVEWADAQQ